jgi:hypothetical protein
MAQPLPPKLFTCFSTDTREKTKKAEEGVPVHKLRLSGAVILCNLEIKNSYTVKD